MEEEEETEGGEEDSEKGRGKKGDGEKIAGWMTEKQESRKMLDSRNIHCVNDGMSLIDMYVEKWIDR